MLLVPISEASQVGEARRQAANTAEKAGFAVADAGRAAIVATELATNIIKHGGGGDVLIGAYETPDGSGIEILALDRGPGIANLQACLVDGYSSAGTAGNGLGAIFRQSHLVEVVSWPGLGTAFLARFEPGTPPRHKKVATAQWGAVCVAMPGEEVSGDAWTVDETADVRTLLVADGLGHGPDAGEAAVQAIRVFHRHKGHQPATILDYIHGGLRSTRGAAVSLARMDKTSRKLVYAGIGNVAGAIVAEDGIRRMVSLAGTAGHNARKVHSFEYSFSGGIVVMHSDGLSSSWKFDRYPGLSRAHPTLAAAVLFRDFWRRRDDVTVLISRGASP